MGKSDLRYTVVLWRLWLLPLSMLATGVVLVREYLSPVRLQFESQYTNACFRMQYYAKYKVPITQGVKHGQCKAQSVVHVALPLIFGLASDVAILLLPIAALTSLQMGRKKKTAMALLFSVGAL